jgi:hypothetical protein
MILLTPELREQLLASGRERDVDHFPVVKFFNPLGEGVWLATELDEDRHPVRPSVHPQGWIMAERRG